MNSYFEFGGGLGDVLHQCYDGGCFHLLDDIESNVDVTLICHNPFAPELFAWHPRRHLMNIRVLPWWTPEEDTSKRAEYQLPSLGRPVGGRPGMTFYMAPQDKDVLASLPKDYAVIAQGAGLPHRSLPIDLVKHLIAKVKDKGLTPVLTGRSYHRHGRKEDLEDYAEHGVINLIDRLTVPGTCELVKKSKAIITCHSALNIVGWWERRPTLLLYPESVRQFHFLKKDQWSFGMDFPENFMATLEDKPGVEAAISNFFSLSFQEEAKMSSIPVRPFSPGMENITLHWPGGRFTAANDVKALIHEIKAFDGNILEIGCHRGVTTLELAMAFPEKIVYAVDFPGSAVCSQQEWERVRASEFCDIANHIPNVIPIMKPIEAIPLSVFKDVAIVFVDGALSYHQLKRDTEIAQRIIEKYGGGLVVWHDFYEGSPEWVGVPHVVGEVFNKDKYNVWRVDGTWMAFHQVTREFYEKVAVDGVR